MTLPLGDISIGMVATELGISLPLSLGDPRVRALAGKPSGPISLGNLRGKSAYTPPSAFIQGPLYAHEFGMLGDPVFCSVSGTLEITGGEAPFNITWARTGGVATIAVTGTTSPNFSTSGQADYARVASFKATVTDNRNNTTTASVSVTLSGGSIAT